jgi:hypothetical protein
MFGEILRHYCARVKEFRPQLGLKLKKPWAQTFSEVVRKFASGVDVTRIAEADPL